MATLPSQIVCIYIGKYSYHCVLSNFTHISLHMLKCCRVCLLSSLEYFSLVSLGDADVVWPIYYYYYYYYTFVVFAT